MNSELRAFRQKIAHYRHDPVLFVQQALKVEPTSQQAQTLRSIRDNPRTSIKSGHGTGKSSGAAFACWWELCCFPHSRVPCTAPTGHQLEDILWSEIAKWGGKLNPWFRNQFDITSDRVVNREHPKTWYAVARTARKETPDALQGFHGDNLLFIVDEASGVPAEIFQPVEGALTGKGNRILIQGNPTQTSGYLFESHRKNRNMWARFTFNSEDSPLVTPDYCALMADQYGRDSDIYRVRVLGEFPHASTAQFIGRDVIDSARGRGIGEDSYRHAAKILMLDVARHGDDQSVILRRQGLASTGLRKLRIADTMKLAGIFAQEIDDYDPDAAFVDATGIGWGVVDRLRQLGYSIIAIQSGEQAINDKAYFNLRAEMWAKMREWLKEGGCLPDDQELCDDLAGPTFSFDAKGRVVLERKEDMKKRGLASPDCADALALSFAQPVAKLPRAGSLEHMQSRREVYDPLEHLS